MANTWTGKFPESNTKEDGFERTSPVKSYPANGYGLYDMGGNVWNWVSDWYRPDTHVQMAAEPSCHNPTGPKASFSPNNPYQQERVTKGGSFLCHDSYCNRYRVAARGANTPHSSSSNCGFRLAGA